MGGDRVETLGRAAWDALQRLVRELLARRPGGHLIEADLERLELCLEIEPKAGGDGGVRFTRELIADIERQLDDRVQHAAAFRPGHAWCHRCDGAACEHSQPPGPRHVFVGYSPTGTPRWLDLPQYCLDMRHPHVDRFYDDPPAFVALVSGRGELYGNMLQAFDSQRYRLMGQVIAGFYPVPTRAEEGRGVLALTVQAAASRSSRGGRRLGLNVLGRAPGGEELAALWERQEELPWRRAVLWAQEALRTVRVPPARRRASEDGPDPVEARVEGILKGLARRLERDRRARSRRTRHAEERHVSGERPTRKAIDDARVARREACLVDERSLTFVVLGERGRTHFFTFDGQHVSSVRYSREAIERKIKLDVWRPATPEELAALREKLP